MSMMLRWRQRLLTPSSSHVTLANRGFHDKHAEATAVLETIGTSFLTGYGYAVGTRDQATAQARLDLLPRRFRGFAYEGAAMGYAMLDGLGLTRPRRVTAFLAGPGGPHVYMAYVGIGWACARLPRWRWRRILPADSLLCWLALDGYGFHQAYFHTRRYVHARYQEPVRGWPYALADQYASRAIDQGIGRALWFVEGTDVDRLAARIAGFPSHRRLDLWSGAALAATYAGGADEAELRAFWKLAGQYRPNVAQAAAFAAEARVRAGLVVEHTELATEIFCGMSPAEAAACSDQIQSSLPADASSPAYEVWRARLAERFASLGRR